MKPKIKPASFVCGTSNKPLIYQTIGDAFDQAVIDAEGYCDIVGRVKDMIIRGGENIYPRLLQ